METIKVTVNLDTKLVTKVDKFAESMSINRTSALSVLLNQALLIEDSKRFSSKMTDSVKEIKDLFANALVTDENKQKELKK